MASNSSNPLISGLQNPGIYDHPITGFEIIETHISWVVLTGDYAYKIKKPVNLGFLDFSTLGQRQRYCQQELALNRRLAPQIYLDVVSITGNPDSPSINGDGPAIDYAVKMRQFPQAAQLDRILNEKKLSADHIDQLADSIAAFHESIEVAQTGSNFGEPETVLVPVKENFDQIRPLLSDAENLSRLQQLESWSLKQHDKLSPIIKQRKQAGFVRNCHGDMHLANITYIDNQIVIFDCIEFNDSFRWIDVISEVAFTVMDLAHRGRPDFAAQLLNRYLQTTGDYQGLQLLRFYLVYRVLVRAKVAAIRGHQSGLTNEEQQTTLNDYLSHIKLAEDYAKETTPLFCIAHGVSGSGKTTLTQPLLEHFGMIRIRSDVERKRLYSLKAEARTGSKTDEGIYSFEASQETYKKLKQLSSLITQAGFSVIIDATFLKQQERADFRQQARALNLPFLILHFYANKQHLQKWIKARQQKGTDASEATLDVLESQLASEEPLSDNEAEYIVRIDAGEESASQTLIQAVQTIYDEIT